MRTCDKEGFYVTPRSEAEIRNFAEQFRKVITDNSNLKYLDIVKILEHKMPQLFSGFRYEIVTSSEMPDNEAEMNPTEFCIRIQEPVYIKAIEGDGHCRFTIAHELGHFFLHRNQTLAFAKKAKDGDIPTYANSEWQADVFARNLLAPFSMTQNLIPKQIEILFGVSQYVSNIIAGTNNKEATKHKTSDNITQMTFNFI